MTSLARWRVARLLRASMHAAVLLGASTSCCTTHLWKHYKPQVLTRQEEVRGEHLVRSDPSTKGLAIEVGPYMVERFDHLLPMLKKGIQSLWIEPIDDVAWQALLDRLADRGDFPGAHVSIRVDSSMFGDDYQVMLWVDGEESSSLACRVRADGQVVNPTAAPFRCLDFSVANVRDENYPLAIKILLTPFSVAIDIPLLPFQAVALYMAMKSAGY